MAIGSSPNARAARLAVVASVLSIAPFAGCGAGGGKTSGAHPAAPTPPRSTGQRTTTERRTPGPNRAGRKHHPPPPRRSSPGRNVASARAARAAVRDYLGALDARDGSRVCKLFTPGALDALKLPRRRGSCAQSISASIGYRDPRGFPVWKRVEIRHFKDVAVTGSQARVTVTVRTIFAGNREPSIEDDVIYLGRSGDRWLLLKPSAEIYRAIGAASPPPSALAPP